MAIIDNINRSTTVSYLMVCLLLVVFQRTSFVQFVLLWTNLTRYVTCLYRPVLRINVIMFMYDIHYTIISN